MTERLYYDNAYLTAFDAQVLACRPCGEAYEILLDKSAFYPTSGGQPFDTGWLNDVRVTDVNVADGQVWHTAERPLESGTHVRGRIDWDRRFDHMQQHAADHMIASALHRHLGGVTIGLHISADVSTIDVAMPGGATRITEDDVRRMEEDVNERVQRNVPIRCWFPEPAELAALPLRKPPTVDEHVRIVAIGEDEMVACGGTHPARAGELGLVKILSVAPARGKMRVTFLAGRRALADYRACRHAAHEAAGLLSSPIPDMPAALRALQERLLAAEGEVTALRREQLFAQAEQLIAGAEILPCGAKLIVRTVEADAALLRDLASRLIRTPGVIALLAANTGSGASFVFGRAEDVPLNMGALLRTAAQPLGGRGGGRPAFAQGGGDPAILECAAQLAREGLHPHT